MSTDSLFQNSTKTLTSAANGSAEQFLNSVLSLRPGIAVFDCDGTLWSGDAGAEFFYWELEQGLISEETLRRIKPRYDDYKAGRVDEATMCGEMVTLHKGLTEADMEAAAERFFSASVERNIFPVMRELTRKLAESGCELWAVSSTNEWVVRAGTRRFGIPDDHVLAACVHIENACATDRLRRVPTDEGKATAIREVIARHVDAAFGNSMHDAAMLGIAGNAFAINPNPDLEQLARERGWTIHFPKPAQR
jgi:HAD superfamily hydrolase (TIGR01490 family)